MTPKAAVKATNTDTDTKVKKAKRLFIVGLLDLSWRLAVAIIIPVLLGSLADKKLDKEPIFTIIGLFIGLGIAVVVIRNLVIKLQKETSEK
ncbi:MAG TPA: AtpZ/AtpI family protein [Candidatus Saccharimonadales bacterium]|nr:AtpZ/AtpI family protein [Candidatus Saccharimonadales bacterium]